MAMTFSSQQSKQISDDLNVSATNLTNINSALGEILTKTKNVYSSDSAEQVYSAYQKMQDEFPNFIKAVTACSTELAEVAKYIEGVEAAAASKVGM